MSYTNGLDKPSDYFNTKLFTGNGSSGHAISGVGFKSDWTWIKNRSASNSNHRITDAVRGVTKEIYSDLTAAEYTNTDGLTAFGSDGFTVGSNADYNGNGNNIVSWNWKAGGSASSNTDGTQTSSVSVNQDAGFSIMTYSGTTAVDTYGHGLSQKPEMIFIKRRTFTGQWIVYNKTIGATHNLHLDSTDASSAYQYFFNNTEPTSSVITLSDDGEVNKAGSNYVAYVFHSVKGYSKIGSYTGNGSGTDGTFVYTGFKPAWVMTKRTDGTAGWHMQDNKRNGFNYQNYRLFANTNASSTENSRMDLLSNGFKYRDGDGNYGANIYMAFAENPFVTSTGVPATAR